LSTISSFIGSRIHASMLVEPQRKTRNQSKTYNPRPHKPRDDGLINIAVKSTENATWLSSLIGMDTMINKMSEALEDRFKKENITMKALELPIIDKNRLFLNNNACRPCETRIDYIAEHNNQLVIGDIKSLLGNTTQFKVLPASHLRQILIYAYLYYQNYGKKIDTLQLMYVPRDKQTHFCELSLSKLLGNTNAKNEYISLISNWHSSSHLYYDKTYIYKNRAPALRELKTFCDFFDLQLEAAQAIATPNKLIFFNGGTLFQQNQNVFTFEAIGAAVAGAAVIGAPLEPKRLHPDFHHRNYAESINVPLKVLRAELQKNVFGIARAIVDETNLNETDPEDLLRLFNLRPHRGDTIRNIVLRKFQRLLNQTVKEKISSEGVVGNNPVNQINQEIEEPLSFERFSNFTNASRRDVWSRTFFEFAQNELFVIKQTVLNEIELLENNI